MNPQHLGFILIGLAVLVTGVFAFVILVLVRPWIKGFMSGCPVSLFDLLGMRLRGNNPNLLIEAYVMLRMRNIPVNIQDVEREYAANKHQINSSAELAKRIQNRVSGTNRE